MFNIVMNFQYALCSGWFSRSSPKIFRIAFSNNTAGGTFLISSDFSLKNSRTPFNSLMPGGDKRSYIRSQTSN